MILSLPSMVLSSITSYNGSANINEVDRGINIIKDITIAIHTLVFSRIACIPTVRLSFERENPFIYHSIRCVATI